MRSISAMPLLLLLAPGMISAQNSAAGTGNAAGTVYKAPLQIQQKDKAQKSFPLSGSGTPSLYRQSAPPSADSCPVSLRARRQGAVIMHYAGDQQPDRTPSQTLEVIFFNSQPRNVVSAVLRVHGYDASVQMMPANTIRKGSHDLSRTIDVNISVVERRWASTDLTMRQFGTVSRIDVESVEFADGTSWKASEQGLCSFTPDLYMLVSSSH
jgi:hypothetical protein